MKFYLVSLLTNTHEQDGSTVAVYSELDKAKVAYHQKLANFHNAEDVLYAVVEILDEYGRVVGGENGYREIVDHKPQPEPEGE